MSNPSIPASDLSRSASQEPDASWPAEVKISVKWPGPGGKMLVRSETISADQFFGRGGHGAPLSGEHVISMIERMRRAGAPDVRRVR